MAKEVKVKDSDKKVLDMLLENSIALQKTLADLAADLKTLNQKVGSLLNLFEITSKTIKERPVAKVPATKELIDKIDALAKQNKTIAKGLLLLERAIREKKEKIPAPSSTSSTTPRPLPEI